MHTSTKLNLQNGKDHLSAKFESLENFLQYSFIIHTWGGSKEYGFHHLIVNFLTYKLMTLISIHVQTLSSTSTGSMPKNGLMGNPGLGVELSGEGRGVIIIPPVSEIIMCILMTNTYILLHYREGNMGKYSARGWQYLPDRRKGQYRT